MKWQISHRLQECANQNAWNCQFNALKTANEGKSALEICQRLSDIAYLNYSLDTENEFWKNALDRTEEFLQAAEDRLECLPETNEFYAEIFSELLQTKVHGNAFFHAINSSIAEMRHQALFLARQFLAKHRGALFSKLKGRYANLAITAPDLLLKAKFDSFTKAFADLKVSSVGEQPKNLLPTNEAELVSSISDFLQRVFPPWKEVFVDLLANSCFDTSWDTRGRLSAAYAMPAAFGEYPAVFVHSLASLESFLGFVHEVGHAIHFYSYKKHENCNKLPKADSIEIFPIFLELLWSSQIQPEIVTRARIKKLVSVPSNALEFQMQWLKKKEFHECDALAFWETVCKKEEQNDAKNACTIFPPDLWMLRRSVWEDHEELRVYLHGAISASLLFLKCQKNCDHGDILKSIDRVLHTNPLACSFDAILFGTQL